MQMQALTLDRFKRVNNRMSPELIQADELAILYDAVLNYKAGKPIKRGRFSRYDAGIATGNGDILRVADVKNSSGTQYLLAATGDEVQVYNISGNSWGSLILSLTSGFKFRMVPFADKYILTFDTDDDPVVLFNDLSTYYNLELTGLLNSQVRSIQSFHDNGGNLTQNTQYKWVIVGLTEDGQLGPVSLPFTHFVDTERARTTDNDILSTKIYFKNLPYISDQRVVSRLLFRTKANDEEIGSGGYKLGHIYYLVTTLDNDSTGSEYQQEFEDNIADDDLGTRTAIYLNTPTRAKYLCYSNERLFLGNFSEVDKMHIFPPATNTAMDGTHTAGTSATVLTDSTQSWTTDAFVGMVITNVTDGSTGTITANTATTITVSALSGGSGNNWETGDVYTLAPSGWAGGYSIDITETASGGTLAFNTQFDYRVHFFDQYGRMSQSYHELTVTTANDASNTHRVDITGIGMFGQDGLDLYSGVKIYRRTGGTGSYYLIMSVSLSAEQQYQALGGSSYYGSRGYFRDAGLADLTEVWVNPSTVTNSYPSGISFSEISSPYTIPDENKKQIVEDDGQGITGLFDDADGIVIFKENSICKVFLSGDPNNWRLYKYVENIGGEDETICRLGRVFYFMHNNKAYRWTVGPGQPEDIGYLYQNEFTTIEEWYDSTINNDWWCIQASDGSNYITFVYDMKLDTWYKFIRQQNASEDFKTIYFTKNGSSEQLLSNCDDRVSLYNELIDNTYSATRADTETGTTIEISPEIETKKFTFPDNITLARLRKLKFAYTKVTGQNTIITLKAGTNNQFVDSSGSGAKLYENIPEAGSVPDLETNYLTINITGAGFEKFNVFRQEYRSIRKGKAVGI